jgi:hypothetical protein
MDLTQIEAVGLGSQNLPLKHSRPGTMTVTARIDDGTNKDVNFEFKGGGGARRQTVVHNEAHNSAREESSRFFLL